MCIPVSAGEEIQDRREESRVVVEDQARDGSEATDKTRHPKIYIGKIAGVPAEGSAPALARLRVLASDGSAEAIRDYLGTLLHEAQLNGATAAVDASSAAD